MKTCLKKWGNSLALRIPKSFASHVGLEPDATVELSLEEGKIIIAPATPSFKLEDLLAGITKLNLHGETDTGPAVGKEIW